MNDATELRRRHDALVNQLDQQPSQTTQAPVTCVLQTVTVTTYPTVAQAVYGVKRVMPSGTEAEGATPTLTTVGSVFYATNTGGTIPPNGSYCLGTCINGRWTFRYG